jgi:hypothetical protein
MHGLSLSGHRTWPGPLHGGRAAPLKGPDIWPVRTCGMRVMASKQISSMAKPVEASAVVLGGGWAGFGAAFALAKAGVQGIRVIDAAASPGGLAATSVVKGHKVEPGKLFFCMRQRGAQQSMGWQATFTIIVWQDKPFWKAVVVEKVN